MKARNDQGNRIRNIIVCNRPISSRPLALFSEVKISVYHLHWRRKKRVTSAQLSLREEAALGKEKGQRAKNANVGKYFTTIINWIPKSMASLLKGQQQSAVSKTSKSSAFFPIHKINTVQCSDQQIEYKTITNKCIGKQQSTSL